MSTETVQNRLRWTWRMFKILTFCSFEKHFMTGTALHTNEILQYFVLDKIVTPFTAKKYYSVCVNFNVDFCNKYAFLWCVAKLFCFSVYTSTDFCYLYYDYNESFDIHSSYNHSPNVWVGGCSECLPVIYETLFHNQNRTNLVNYKYKDCIIHLCF